ncbi:C39 family peptidase [Persicobacter diffluens]|uniref:LysM domain-containing protein n=1 Tax=Persicobacter diffluens TaxID=981 RepID=A0AAN5AL84_9BACT|nr:hypothetical protein PEDI_17480 [Persicobacter diffluens]
MSTKQDVLHNSPQIRQNQEPQRQSFQDYQEMQQSEEAILQDFRAELAAHKSGKPNNAGADVPLAERDAAYYQRYPLEEIKDFYMGSPESRAQVLKAKGIEIPELPHTPITPVEERREDLVAVAQELVQEKQTPNTYEVQEGDRLEVIAAKFGVAVSDLKAANAEELKQWGNIEGFNAGTTIEIPSSTSTPIEQEVPKQSEVLAQPQEQTKEEEKVEDQKGLKGGVAEGALTYFVEGNDDPDSLYFSRRAHWPGGGSGVTIGRGYDLGHRGTSTLVENEFKQAGIPISPWKSAIGLQGDEAKSWLKGNVSNLPIINHQQQDTLFNLAFAEKKYDAERMATKKDVTAKYGATDWAKLDPMIKEVLYDLTYRGDYHGDSRQFLQPHVVKNDLEGFTKELKNRNRWPKVSDQRFEHRVAFLEGRLAGLKDAPSQTEVKAPVAGSPAEKTDTATISAGVGSGSAANNKADVLLIQARLHELGLLSPTAYADEKAKAEAVETVVDQKDLKATIAAIYKFQQQVLHWSSSDGNIGGASSKTLAELNGTTCTAEYVKQRIEQYPQVKAEREAKAAADKARREKEAEEAKKAEEQRKAEAARVKAIQDEPATDEHAKKYISDNKDPRNLAVALKEHVSLNPDLVCKVLSNLGRTVRDNFTYALMHRVSDGQLRKAGKDLLTQMRESLDAWLVSKPGVSYAAEIGRIDSFLGVDGVNEVNEIEKEILTIFEKERLTPEEIAEVRALILQFDKTDRPKYYQILQRKVGYKNQRDNDQTNYISDRMCNLTSLAMALEYLGVSNPEESSQFEDYLEKVRIDNELGSRTMASSWSKIASEFDVKTKEINLDTNEKGKIISALKPELELGNSIIISAFSIQSTKGHIVRLQEISDKGLIVDDPFGKIHDFAAREAGGSGYYKKGEYSGGNERTSTSTKGEDNLWTWDDIKQTKLKYARSFYTEGEKTNNE